MNDNHVQRFKIRLPDYKLLNHADEGPSLMVRRQAVNITINLTISACRACRNGTRKEMQERTDWVDSVTASRIVGEPIPGVTLLA